MGLDTVDHNQLELDKLDYHCAWIVLVIRL